MISVEECRKHLGDIKMTDEQIIELRSATYELAEFALDSYFHEKREERENNKKPLKQGVNIVDK